jgi:hypothetical protein
MNRSVLNGALTIVPTLAENQEIGTTLPRLLVPERNQGAYDQEFGEHHLNVAGDR